MRKFYYTSKKNGVDMTCDICGQTSYFKRLKGHEYVNGRLTPEEYEGLIGWTRVDNRDICPCCNAKDESRK